MGFELKVSGAFFLTPQEFQAGRPAAMEFFSSNTIFSPGAPDEGNHFPFARFFGMGTGAIQCLCCAMIKPLELYIQTAMFTAAVATIVALMVW